MYAPVKTISCFVYKELFRKFGIYNRHFQSVILRPCSTITIKANYSNSIVNQILCNNCSNALHFSTNVQGKEKSSELVSEVTKEDVGDSEQDFYDVDEEAITNGDPDLLKSLKILMLEIEVYRQEGMDVPSKLKVEHWKELLTLRTRTQRLKTLRFWFLKQVRKENDKLRKKRKTEARIKELKEVIENTDPTKIRYGLGGNTFLLRISEVKMNILANNRLIMAMQFGQDLIIDCSYDEFMVKKEQHLCAKQMMFMFALNRNHDQPFNIHFCSANRDGHTIGRLKKLIPTMDDCDFPMNVHEKGFMELFPKERLVYLTPHCRTELKTFNHDDIYIVGGIVDRSNCEPLSLAKAKSLGIRMAKFPLDRYLMWALGSKSLTLDQVVAILLEVKTSGNWSAAFEHVPKRKLVREPTEREVSEMETERDKSPHFGQSYVATHEWGRPKKGRARHNSFDLRSVISLKEKAK